MLRRKVLVLSITLAIVFLAVGTLISLQFQLPKAPVAVSEDFVLQSVTIINPKFNILKNTDLHIKEGKIKAIGNDIQKTRSFKEFEGSFVLPGLINMHAHNPARTPLKLTPLFALLAISHGVTTWRDVADPDGTSVSEVRSLINENKWPVPNVFSCALVTTGHARWASSIIMTSVNEAPKIATDIRKQGHSCIKSYENLSPEFITALKDAATKEGLHVAGHVPSSLTYEQAALPDTQHFFGVPPVTQNSVVERNGNWEAVESERIDEVVKFVLENDLINTPTLVTLLKIQEYGDYERAKLSKEYAVLPSFYIENVWHPDTGLPVYRHLNTEVLRRAKNALKKKQDLLIKLSNAGATLNLGTDTQQPFVVPGASYWHEIKLFAEAGIPIEDIWANATWRAGQQLTDANLGVIQIGAPADLLIFKENPTKSLNALKSLQAIVVRGNLYRKHDIDSAIRAMQNHFSSWPLEPMAAFFAERKMQEIAKNFTH